ncbi:hypothetical protein ACVWZA_002904 [Sphingomonas sp. UYAg733]
MLLALLLVQAISAATTPTVPPSGPALTAEIATRDAEFFQLYFEGCDQARLATTLTPDFEMYHDKGGKVASSAAPFIAEYVKNCANRARPDAWRTRGVLVTSSLKVEAIPGFGAIEEGDHDFYERQGDGAERKAGTAHFMQLWQRTADGWRLSRVFSFPPCGAIAGHARYFLSAIRYASWHAPQLLPTTANCAAKPGLSPALASAASLSAAAA